MSIHVQLDRFEGPLGLLLHLIREQEMDIFNINIHHITRQYLEYIKTMRRLDLEVAGEFVAMAATLLHIKSRMLLPQYNEEGEEITEDPRKELVQKLLEYKKFRELSADLYKRPLLGRDVFTRGERDAVESLEEGELVLEENPLFSLIASYRTAVRNMKKTVHKVTGSLQSIAERIMEMKDLLVIGHRVVFSQFLTATENRQGQKLVTFLSLLELAKMGLVNLFQNEAFSDIHVEAKRAIDKDVVSQVENYDAVHAELAAQKIMDEAATAPPDSQLSLLEPEAMLEGEEAPVVVEAFADAATDAEIEAEEAALFAVPGSETASIHLEPATVEPIAPDPDEVVSDIGIAVPIVASEFVEVNPLDMTDEPLVETDTIAEAMHEEIHADPVQPLFAAPVEEVVSEHSLDEMSDEELERLTRPDQESGDGVQDSGTEIPASDTGNQIPDIGYQVADIGAQTLTEEATPEPAARPEFFSFQSIQEMPQDFIETAEEVATEQAEIEAMTAEPAAESIVDKNVNSAVTAALQAFDAFNEDEDPKPERPPEVES